MLDARQIAHAEGLSRAMLNALYLAIAGSDGEKMDSRGVVSPAAREGPPDAGGAAPSGGWNQGGWHQGRWAKGSHGGWSWDER